LHFSTEHVHRKEVVQVKLANKLIIGVNAFMLLIAISISVLAYHTANESISVALEFKAEGDVYQMVEMLDDKFPGPWTIRNGELYKGFTKISDNFEVVDKLRSLTGDHITIFLDDVRVSTSFVNKDGSRPVGTKASQEVATTVLGYNRVYRGTADVLGDKYLCAYVPIQISGGRKGMLFVGIPRWQVESLQSMFIHTILVTVVPIVLVTAVLMYMVIKSVLKPLTQLDSTLTRVSSSETNILKRGSH